MPSPQLTLKRHRLPARAVSIEVRAAVINSCRMRGSVSVLALSLVAAVAAKATLVVIVPARGATAVCADRRFFDTKGGQFDSDDKLQLLPPHAAFFVVGLEAVSDRDRVLYSPATVFRRFLAERAAEGIPADIAIRDTARLSRYLRDGFEGFLKDHNFPRRNSTRVEIGPSFALGIVRTENHIPHLDLFTVSQNARKPTTATINISHGMEGMFSRSDPMYVGQMDVVLGLAKREPGLSRFTTDAYVKQFLLANFGMPLEQLDTALTASRRLISVTADGLTMNASAIPSVSREAVCAVLDYETESAQYK